MALTISHDDVHLWTARLDRDTGEVERLTGTLSVDEISRAARFLRPEDRERFIVARGTLRAILGAYLGARPELVRFVYGLQGKPALAPGLDPTLCFNIAHSGDLALFGIARVRRIGVDVERVRAEIDYEAIARRFFTTDESAALRAVPAEDRLHAFYTMWTGKEAYAKALGDGLAAALRGVRVLAEPGQAATLLPAPGSAHDLSVWALCLLEPAPGYLGAVVVEGHGWRLTRHREEL